MITVPDASSQPVLRVLPRTGVSLRLLSRSDLADIPVTTREVVEAVRGSYLALAEGASRCHPKIMTRSSHRDSVTYAMPGYDGRLQITAFKDYYMQNDGGKKEYQTITLYDDQAGLPIALMDCDRVTGLRTAASTALIAEACAAPAARTALVTGSGAMARQMFPFLLETLPGLERLLLFATSQDGVDALRASLRVSHPGLEVELVADPEAAAGGYDVVVATSAGPATEVKFRTSWLPPGALFVSVNGTGVHSSSLRDADHGVATSAGQLAVTGTRFADESGQLPPVAELPEVLAGRSPARRSDSDRVFAFNSGLAITDIPVAHALAVRAIAAGRGREVALWS